MWKATHKRYAKKNKPKKKRNNALFVAQQLGIKLHIVDVVNEYKDVLLNPNYGYGQHLNPCLDCKIFMVKKAYQWMKDHNFDFIITGEVIGQRPKSQRRETMPIVANDSGAQQRLLRPLCAKHLPATLPEQEGWVDRDKLFAFNGRTRKPQIELANNLQIDDYAQPAGGCCFLTDKKYSAKLTDLWQARHERDYELDDIILLKIGRHIRPKTHFKLIVAREEGENNFLSGYTKQFAHITIESHNGPLTLIDGPITNSDIPLAGAIAARYSAGKLAPQVTVALIRAQQAPQTFTVKPLAAHEIEEAWHV